MIFISRDNPGRLGNRLFLYHFLRQLAQAGGSDYSQPRLENAKYFSDMEAWGQRPHFWTKRLRLDPRLISGQAPAELLKTVKAAIASGRPVEIKPPVLGESFFAYCFADPNDFVKIKAEHQDLKLPAGDDVINIGLHFRGGDFAAWDTQAILPADYYISALQSCLTESASRKIYLHIFTDDEKLESYIKTKEFIGGLSVADVSYGDRQGEPIRDLYRMSQCDILISSPSTFAIWGGILGRRKRIIHSRVWLDYAIAKSDRFWQELAAGGNEYYKLWKTF